MEATNCDGLCRLFPTLLDDELIVNGWAHSQIIRRDESVRPKKERRRLVESAENGKR